MNNIVFVKVESTFAANTLKNAVANAKASDAAVSVSHKIGMSRKTGKLVMTISEANVTAKALEDYSKTTEHAPSAKMAKELATAIRFRTASACKAAKAVVEA